MGVLPFFGLWSAILPDIVDYVNPNSQHPPTVRLARVKPEAAISAITSSRVEASLALGRTPIGVALSSPEICWAISGIPMAAFNAAIRLRTAPNADHQIEAIQQTFAQQSMPFVWWVTQQDSEDGLETKLRSHGFDYDGDESIGMAMALSSQLDPIPIRESASVERISEERDVRKWFATLLESVDTTADERTMDLATTVFSHLANDELSGWHLYLAHISERPAGTCALHLGTTAGLYSVGTVPVARRLGVGTALTKRALEEASSAGYRVASLTASGLGARLYEALGFNEYCRFREYVWRPPSSTDRG